MITIKELNPTEYKLEPYIMANLIMLWDKMNDVRKVYGKPMTVTSGIRTVHDQIRIYKNIANRKGVAFDQTKVPMRSNHLFGLACDIYDPEGLLKHWILRNITSSQLEGFYFEDFRHTLNWVHFQIVPPKSGRKFFIP